MWFLVIFIIMSGVYINFNKKLQESTKVYYNVGLAIVLALLLIGQIL